MVQDNERHFAQPVFKKIFVFASVLFILFGIGVFLFSLVHRAMGLIPQWLSAPIGNLRQLLNGALLVTAALAVLWLIALVFFLWHGHSKSQKKVELNSVTIPSENLRRIIQAKYQRRFLGSFTIYSGIIALLAIVFILLKDSRIWYDYEPWYNLLFSMKTLFPYVLVCLWTGGVAILLFAQWRQNAADTVGLVESINQMQSALAGSQIKAPENLIELEPTLQAMFNKSCEDRRIAEEAEKRKSDLILYLAHDLRTPLTSVIGYLDLLANSKDLSYDQKTAYLEIAQNKAMRLEDLIEQFFEISRFSLHETDFDKRPFVLSLLIEQLTEELFPLLEEHGKTIEVITNKNIVICGDADLLARAFNNILKNAIAYSNADSLISVSAENTEDGVSVSITNEGYTIPQESLDSIFEKFFRLDEARNSKTAGSGLGLAIAKQIIEGHDGSISATSDNGKTCFTVNLPLHISAPGVPQGDS
ncbi:MAG: HAMP domain-containing histidine kinase [Coriobacteriales bacterium]|jgi:two-component system sensor histidine kinase VanS|nr:HAMP domain-containing histidine kinase [Coriobacteriales bacterium]